MKKVKYQSSGWVLKGFLFAVLSIMLLGCATIIKHNDQSIPISTNPSGATLTVYDLRSGYALTSGTTPYTVTLKRGSGYFKKARYRVRIEKDDYDSKEILLEGSANGWYLGGNILVGGLIGWFIVDPITGAMWTLKPEQVNEVLSKEVSFLEQKEGLMIVLSRKSDLPPSLRDKLKRVNFDR